MAWVDTTVKTSRDGSLTIAGGGTAETCSVSFDKGDFSFTEKKNVVVIKQRGVLDHLRNGEDEPIAVSFTLYYTGLTHSANVTPYAALTQTDNATGWTSTSSVGDVFTTNLTFAIDEVDSSETETITIEDFAMTDFKFDEAFDGNVISVSGIAMDVQCSPAIA